jgi:AAA domain/UvrD-like helicase C-terminal domain
MTGDDLQHEQAVIDRAYSGLAAMRARTTGLLAELRAAGKPDPDLEFSLSRRISQLSDVNRPLCFGRIDREDGTTWYLGRRHVEDDKSDPLVIEWRVPVAMPFYRARPGEPLGLVRRRQLMVEQRRLVSYADDRFGEGADAAGEHRIRGGDALLAELERARTGEMADIVATIQAEQDEVIRAPLEGVLAVQGGPGTGKTAIGLHRAAYLLYNHPDLARAGVLVVGPSRTFLRYIAQVLPSLGEEAVVQVAVADLVPGVRCTVADPDEVQRLKGDERMALLVAKALADRRQPLEDDLSVHVGLRRVVVPAEAVNRLVESLAARGAPYQSGRAALRANLVGLVERSALQAIGPVSLERARVARELATQESFAATLDRAWPSVSAATLVAELLASPSRLAAAAAGLLDPGEQSRLLRRAPGAGAPAPGRPAGERPGGKRPGGRRPGFATADLPLIDEAQALLHGRGRTYGHVVVDEAQDLSPMQLRMLARRCPVGSLTVLGDLAQSTGVWAHTSWEEVVGYLPRPDGWRSEELTLGYRAPGQVLDFASRLLPESAPGVRPTDSVRAGRRSPRVMRVGAGELFATACRESAELAAEGYHVGCIVADDELRAAGRAFAALGVEHGIAERDGLGKPVTLLGATGAKGLEFDAVVVVEPAAIAAGTARGLRLLYVALTRPIQHLSVVHAEPLPALLAAAA